MPLNPYENSMDRTKVRGKPSVGMEEAFLEWLKNKYGMTPPDPGNRRFNKQMEQKRLGLLHDQILAQRMAQKNRLYGGA